MTPCQVVSLAPGHYPMTLPTEIEERLARLRVNAADVEERFVRGSGPGGQKINKTSSTVWLRHGPTGVEVRCQAERSQSANRETAWRELCDKLEARVRVAAAQAQGKPDAVARLADLVEDLIARRTGG